MTLVWAGLLGKAGTPVATSRSRFHAQGRLREKETLLSFDPWSMVKTVKYLPAMQETRVRPLGWEDPLEKRMATHFSSNRFLSFNLSTYLLLTSTVNFIYIYTHI